MSLRRGFKAECDAYSREFRAELSLAPHDPLCPWALAKHFEIPVIALSALGPSIPTEVRFLKSVGRDFFSAVTIFVGQRRAILHNDGNARTRQASDVAHELAHAILMHPPTPLFNDIRSRTVDKVVEAEAQWLGPALLISAEAALHIARSGVAAAVAARKYGVSESLLCMRLNVTGAQ